MKKGLDLFGIRRRSSVVFALDFCTLFWHWKGPPRHRFLPCQKLMPSLGKGAFTTTIPSLLLLVQHTGKQPPPVDSAATVSLLPPPRGARRGRVGEAAAVVGSATYWRSSVFLLIALEAASGHGGPGLHTPPPSFLEPCMAVCTIPCTGARPLPGFTSKQSESCFRLRQR